MSTAMDVPPVNIETSPAHSSTQRTPLRPSPPSPSPPSPSPPSSPLRPSPPSSPLRPSPLSSPAGNMDMCTTLGLSSKSSITKAGFERSILSRLSASLPPRPLCHERSRSLSPVVASFLTGGELEPADSTSSLSLRTCSPAHIEQKSTEQKTHHEHEQRCQDSRCSPTQPLTSDKLRSQCETIGPLEQSVKQTSALSKGDAVNDVSKGDAINDDTCDSSISGSAATSDDFENTNDDNDNIVNLRIHEDGPGGDDDPGDEDDDESDKDDDQVECAECGKVFSNLRLYMDHTCYRSQVACRAANRCEGDSFHGTMVFNPSGSAYIFEGNSQDYCTETDMNLVQDSVVVSEVQSVLSIDACIPQVHSVTFFPRNDSTSVFSSFRSASPTRPRYQVFHAGTREANRALNLHLTHPTHKQTSGPLLMCVICKLVFKKSKPFLNHSFYFHSVDVNEQETALLNQSNISMIVYINGQGRQPKLSLLYPMIEANKRLPDMDTPFMYSRADLLLNGGFAQSDGKPHRDSCIFPYQGTVPSKKRNLSIGLKGESASGHVERSLKQYGVHVPMTRESCTRRSSLSDTEEREETLAGSQHPRTSQTVTQEASVSLGSSMSVTASGQLASSSPSSSGSDTFFQSSSSNTNVMVPSMPPLVMPSSNSSNMFAHMNLSSASSSSLPTISLQMPHFLCACDEHPQGKAQGMECPKCDMILSSSHSLGGHMTMTHSRNSCKTLKCPKCNWHYKYQETLEIHMKEKHLDSDAQCVYCLTNQAHPRLARGESYSCGYKPYRCEVCNYSTTTKGNLSIHMQSDKHINNMQDLANGSAEVKMQPQQPIAALTSSTPVQNSPQSYHQDDGQLKKIKQKQSFRCDVCSYETSVARNLRIHMTSEKHTHNMLVVTQSMNHLHQDLTLHQMNQLLAINQQEQAARYAAINSHLSNPMFPYDQSAMLITSSSSPSPAGFEIPINLSKEPGTEDMEGPASRKDATKMFQCCICYKYGSDSMENVHNHIQYDRTKSVNSEAYVTFSSGTHHCNLCSYKTHLKANFQLHCKTDKHLQKLQLVSHIMEGGLENEWKLAQAGSSMQICCNACSFFANSVYKMQLHMSTIQHESCAQLFRHLQLLDQATPAPLPGRTRYYQCSLCPANVHTKQKLVTHSRSVKHVRNEQSLLQGHVSIFDVYLLKEMLDGDTVNFEDEVDGHTGDDPQVTDVDSTSHNPKVTSAPPPRPAHSIISTAASAQRCSGSNINASFNYSLFRPEAAERIFSLGQDSDKNEWIPETLGVSRTLTVASHNSGPHSSSDNAAKNETNTNSTSKCDKKENNFDIGGTLNCPPNFSRSLSSAASTSVLCNSSLVSSACLLCPLCRHECAEARILEKHLVKEHNVATEGMQRLMSMVDMPEPASATGESSSPSLPVVSSHAESDTSKSSSFKLLSLSSSVSSNIESSLSKANYQDTEPQSDDTIEKNPESSPTVTKTGPDVRSDDVQMSSKRPSSTPSSPSLYSSSITSLAKHVTSSPDPLNSLANQSGNPNMTAKCNEDKEFNIQTLEMEHARLLTSEGIDLANQEKLDKEYEELFRCQSCSKSFSNIDCLYSHQNELGHLELKQTPRGPGYLCWKRGCSQYFKTASTLQAHFREIHARKSLVGILSTQELDMYKFKCGQCSFSFKSLEVMQKHTFIHLIQSVTQCPICFKRVNSVGKIRRHLETDHGDLSLSDMTVHMESIETSASLLFTSPVYEQFTSALLLNNGNIQAKNGISSSGKKLGQEILLNGIDKMQSNDECVEESDKRELCNQDKKLLDGDASLKGNNFLEDYMNSQSMAEEHYTSGERKFKCHGCKMGFTNQQYLLAHKKTFVHKNNEMAERYHDPAKPYICDLCKESFPQKSFFVVHLNSVSHLHKVKQQAQVNGDSLVSSKGSRLTPPLSPGVNSPSTTFHSNGNSSTASDTPAGSSSNIKPYKCNICKVSYNNQPSIEIHLRSVGHKTKASKLAELIQSGQIDVHQALIEHPDPRAAGKQQAQIIADIIHQQATAQAVSNAAASYFNLQGINAVAQLSLLGIIPPSSHYMLSSPQNLLAAMSNAQLDAYYSSLISQFSQDGTRPEKLSNSRETGKEKSVKITSQPETSEKIVNMVIKQDGKIEPAASGHKAMPGVTDCKSGADGKAGRKDDVFPPHFHAPVIARPRGFMGRFKPQLHRSLLENFGFECVMHFNEESSIKQKKVNASEEDTVVEEEKREKKDKNMEETMEVETFNDKEFKVELVDNKGENKDKGNFVKEDDLKEKVTNENKDEDKENIDLPELNKCQCMVCHKHFSNVWVLKNHEEEIHNNFVSPEVIEDFGQKFREGWEKSLPKPADSELLSLTQLASSSPTPTSTTTAGEYLTSPEMPTATTTQSQHQLSAPNYEMSQLLPLMSMNILPMHLPVNLVNLGLQSPLMPSLMMPPVELASSFLPQMGPPSIVDSTGSASSQQQLQATAAHNQKRVRTRISDDQLKVLRQYFDINNSPSEEQVNKMSDQTGLPQKVIKHWFRNTLFKERQRNKDSPYNFNNPPSTSIDLDEYDRTGKIPEVKTEPEEEDDGDISLVSEVKKEEISAVEDIAEDESFEQSSDLIETVPLKIDLTPECQDEGRKDDESHSSSSSPFLSSIPSTPTASGPTTPTPLAAGSTISTTSSLSFSLDAYAANMVRLEAATLQNMCKRANRTRFTDFQIKTLQDYFERNAYPKDDELEHLSKMLGLSARVIVVWFQNARQKARKIYENQPTNDNSKDSTIPFQRTPGLNYLCKKCNSVFQRYYELIKHQKSSCVGESNNNKPIPSLTEDDSNFSYSNDSNFSERQSTPLAINKDKEFQPRSQPQEQLTASSTVIAKLPTVSTAPVTLSNSSSSSSSSSSSFSIPFFKCEKCNLTFSRFDMWQEHQKAHSIAPAMYTPFSSSSAFGMLQSLAHQEDNKSPLAMTATSSPGSLMPPSAASTQHSASQQASAMLGTSAVSPSPSSKRKTDSEDESGDQPRDKRLRTTILPEQLDYLYQQYQIDCNPSRKQLEHIANTVNLKKRVVQVWFQNTRARERKGHYRAHQQLINKRCPFCRALFRAKSALESHLATKHPEEMAKGDINIDLIPDAVVEPQTCHAQSSLPSSSAHGASSTYSITDITKLLPPGVAATIPNYMAFMPPSNSLNLPFPGPSSEILPNSSYEDSFFKKYMSDLAISIVARQEHSVPPSHTNPLTSVKMSAHSIQKPQTRQVPTSYSPPSRPLDAHRAWNMPQPPILPPTEDAPLDLSKPVKPTVSETNLETLQHPNFSANLELTERPMEIDYLRRLSSMDDSFSETQSEMADHEYMSELGNSPPSPSRASNAPSLGSNTPSSTGKRHRTQMSAVQVKVMKHLFQDYKTPTMAECELLGQEIGLAKRVVQVWFQNARAKEKKAKLNSGKPFNAELDFPKSPEECQLCSYKYTHKVTVQDHVFTKAHIDRIKVFLNSQSERDSDVSTNVASLSRSHGEVDHVNKFWNDPDSHRAMGINPTRLGFPQGESTLNKEDKETKRKEKKLDGLSIKEEQQQVQTAMEMTMNAQMLSALGSYVPGIDPAYLSYMYSGLPGYFSGISLPMMQPGLIPEHMLAYDPLAFGTPLTLLQIPAVAIKSVSEKLNEAGALLARYTQDCQALADLHSMVSAADLTVAAESTLDVGYICKKCQMVYPARESCVAHQRSVCMTGTSSLPKGFEPIMKLEQVQYECRACSDRFSTILEFKSHCQLEAHRQRLMKFKAKEAARREAAGSPSSSAPYTSSTSKVISSSSYLINSLTSVPPNNNNSNHNSNQATSPSQANISKPSQCNKVSATSSIPSMFRGQLSPAFNE